MNIETRIREALNPDHEPMASTCCHGECLQGRSCPYRETCTLEGWRNAGKGPVWLKIGGQIRYRLADVLAYEAEAER